MPRILETTTKLYRPLAEIFDFFSRVENLNEVTPSELSFKILTPLPVKMEKGAVIDYTIKLSGIPFHWRTLIKEWNPPYSFVDVQAKGPYSLWHHTHTFEQKEDHVLMTDRVEFLSPGWIFEPIVHHLFVGARVEAIFKYRTQIFTRLFGKSN
jgi:ligand-binding SRPBCC domain-containing protein